MQQRVGVYAMKRMIPFIVIVLLSGCTGSQPAKSETVPAKPATENPQSHEGETTSDPYAAMEAERNAVKESISNGAPEAPNDGTGTNQKVYSGVVEITGDGATPTIVLKTNRGSFVLVGEKSAELFASEGRFVTVMGKPTKGNAVPSDLMDMDQIQVEGIVMQKSGK
jgi:hypothetical protein